MLRKLVYTLALSFFWCAANAQTGALDRNGVASVTDTTPISSRQAPACDIINVRAEKTGSTPLLYAVCGDKAVRLGEAETYSVQPALPASSVLVVRQNSHQTDVELIRLDGAGGVHLDELARELTERLATAGYSNRLRYSIDLAAFRETGVVQLQAADENGDQTWKVPVDLSARIKDVPSEVLVKPTG